MKALARILYGPVLAWAVISAAVLSCTDPAHAQQPPPGYSPQLAQERELLVRLVVRTRRCMFDGSEAMFRNGVTHKAPVVGFTYAQCPATLRWFLTDRAGFTEDEANTLIRGFAESEYEKARSWGAPARSLP